MSAIKWSWLLHVGMYIWRLFISPALQIIWVITKATVTLTMGTTGKTPCSYFWPSFSSFGCWVCKRDSHSRKTTRGYWEEWRWMRLQKIQFNTHTHTQTHTRAYMTNLEQSKPAKGHILRCWLRNNLANIVFWFQLVATCSFFSSKHVIP